MENRKYENTRQLEDYIRGPNIWTIGDPKRENRQNSMEEVIKKIIQENVLE